MLICETCFTGVKVCETHFKVEYAENRICCGICACKVVVIFTNCKLAIPEEESYVSIVVHVECHVMPFVIADADHRRINFLICKSCFFERFNCKPCAVHTGRTDSEKVLCICYYIVFISVFYNKETCCIFDKCRTEPEYHCVMITCFAFHFLLKLRETMPDINVYRNCRVLTIEIVKVEVCTCFRHTCKVENCEVVGVNDTGNFYLLVGNNFRSCLTLEPKHILSCACVITVNIINGCACLRSP